MKCQISPAVLLASGGLTTWAGDKGQQTNPKFCRCKKDYPAAAIIYHTAMSITHATAMIHLTAMTTYLCAAYIYGAAFNIFQKKVDKMKELYYIVTDGRYRPTVGIDCGSVEED